MLVFKGYAYIVSNSLKTLLLSGNKKDMGGTKNS